jgi:hypothetical protein
MASASGSGRKTQKCRVCTDFSSWSRTQASKQEVHIITATRIIFHSPLLLLGRRTQRQITGAAHQMGLSWVDVRGCSSTPLLPTTQRRRHKTSRVTRGSSYTTSPRSIPVRSVQTTCSRGKHTERQLKHTGKV